MVPVTLHRYEYYASYWRMGRPRVLGVNGGNLNDVGRKALKRTTGFVVLMVLYDTPAFRANILPGDVLIGVNDLPIESQADLNAKIEPLAGTECTFTLLRDGKEISLKVKLNPKPL